MKTITTAEFNPMTGKRAVLFSASWCKPCAALKPTLEAIEKENHQIPFFVVDVDESTDLALKFGVRGVPTIIFMDDNTVIERITGNVPASRVREALQKM